MSLCANNWTNKNSYKNEFCPFYHVTTLHTSVISTANSKLGDGTSQYDKAIEKAGVDNRSSAAGQDLSANKLYIGDGEILRFDRVTRNDMGYYICIASNGIPPSVSQRIFLPVLCKYDSIFDSVPVAKLAILPGCWCCCCRVTQGGDMKAMTLITVMWAA